MIEMLSYLNGLVRVKGGKKKKKKEQLNEILLFL